MGGLGDGTSKHDKKYLDDHEEVVGEPMKAENSSSSEDEDSERNDQSGKTDESDAEENGDTDKVPNERVEGSDSSEDEMSNRNTIGNVPLKWYGEEEHIGYDISGKKIKKQARKSKLESFLAGVDDSKNWRKVFDEYNDEEVELTKEETRIIRRLLKQKTPDAEVDPYAPYVDWFVWDGKGYPLSNAPEPKRRFIPSKWEHKKVVAYIKAIRKGLIRFDKPKEEPRPYILWEDDSTTTSKSKHDYHYVPAPKSKLPGHEESYNPSIEYVPTEEELSGYQLMYEDDRPKFIPTRFDSLRKVPAYDAALKEIFARCQDLYLCPRTRKKRVNIDPESLKPKLPSRKELRPYPETCYLEYIGHSGAVLSISIDITGQWIASGSIDGTVRLWEVETTRCLRVWNVGEAVQHVAWNPLHELPILAVAVGSDVLLLDTGLGSEEVQERLNTLLHTELPAGTSDDKSVVSWVRHGKGQVKLRHLKTVKKVEWHRKGDYFTSIMPAGDSSSVLIHQLSKKLSFKPFPKMRGIPVSAVFHPSRTIFFLATRKNIYVYDLSPKKLLKTLETGLRDVSSIAVHPGGDNVLVGSREGKLCWFDMDLSSQPYMRFDLNTIMNHPKDITNVAFHRSYPLFASATEDCAAHVFHGMVYSDLNQNPLIVPLEILRGHEIADGGVMDCKFHPRQPWLFTAGADSVIKLYCH